MALRKNRKRFPLLRLKPGLGRKLLAFAFLGLIALVYLRASFLAQLAMNRGPQMANFASVLTDPDALARLARKEHLVNSNLPRALALYHRGLSYFVLHGPSWLGIVELYNDMGKHDRAVLALRHADRILPAKAETAWTRALLAHDLDCEDVLVANLVWLARNHPQRWPDIFTLADLRWQDPEVLMNHFGPQLYVNLLDNYIRIDDEIKARAVWQAMASNAAIPPETILKYVNFLLRRGRIAEAGRIWHDKYPGGQDLLFNPSLTEPFIGSGFGWRITRREGVSWQPLANSSGLRITFDGTANPSFQLAQLIPLAPGSYQLTGFVRTEGLTTDQRPFWSVSGSGCKGLNARSEMLAATIERHEFSLAFSVPEGCDAVQLVLRRNASYFFDNKIGGSLSLDSLRLHNLPTATRPVLDEPDSFTPEPESGQPETGQVPAGQGPGSTGPVEIRIKKLKVQ